MVSKLVKEIIIVDFPEPIEWSNILSLFSYLSKNNSGSVHYSGKFKGSISGDKKEERYKEVSGSIGSPKALVPFRLSFGLGAEKFFKGFEFDISLYRDKRYKEFSSQELDFINEIKGHVKNYFEVSGIN